jgi:hypothetical protein
MQPRLELGTFLERVNGFEGSDEGFLNRVLRVLAAAEKASRDGQQPSSVTAHQLLECCLVAALKPADQLIVVTACAQCWCVNDVGRIDGHHVACLLS